jgi:hypothetical protein
MNAILLKCLLLLGQGVLPAADTLVPQIEGEWWQISADPDLGRYTNAKQQPVDFGVWQAADGSWQLWSCIRGTRCGGNTRLFYRWQGARITDRDWQPMGIAMEADTAFGETKGGLQAPYVLKTGEQYQLFYGDWEHICVATGADGKTFARQLPQNGRAGMFTEGKGNNTRDVMIVRVGNRYHAYYTAYPNRQGAVFARTSRDLRHWSASKTVAFGGSAGTGPFAAECPFVYFHQPSGYYYLFRTQRYGADAQTSVYRSKDPLNFGVNDDRYLVARLPVAAPEIITYEGQLYIAVLLPSLKGIQVAKLSFVKKS